MNAVSAQPSPLSASVIFGRPLPSRSGFGPETLARHRERVCEEVLRLRAAGGGLLAVAYPAALATGALLLLSAVYARLRYHSDVRSVALLRPRLQQGPQSRLDAEALLVHDLPQDPSLLDALTGSSTRTGRVVVATGPWDAWERLRPDLPMSFTVFDGPDAADLDLDESIAEERDALAGLPGPARDAYRGAALCDAWGVPVPLSLLSRSLHPGTDTDTAEEAVGTAVAQAEQLGLLHWIELDAPAGLLVATRGPMLARAALSGTFTDTDPATELARLIAAADPQDREQRVAVLRLFQAILLAAADWPELARLWDLDQPHRTWLRGLYDRCHDALDTVFAHASADEALRWGRVLEGLADFARGDAVLSRALASDPANETLLQSRARHLGRWALQDRSLIPAATRAFDEACRAAPRNPSIWQARGVWGIEMGDLSAAANHLRTALDRARANSERVYALIALADLCLAQGRPKDTDHYLDQAAAILPGNPYVPHLKGEAARFRGDFAAAERAYRQTRALDPHNVPAAQSQGDLALKRGHWARAAGHLAEALRWQPDNVPALHALAELRADEAIAAQAIGDPAVAGPLFQAAEQGYAAALAVEPGNLRALLALGVLLARQGRFAEAEQTIAAVRTRDPRNLHALHALARIRQVQGRTREAERAFNDILLAERLNLPALIALAGLAAEQGRAAPDLLARIDQALAAPTLAASDRIKARNALALVQQGRGDLSAALATLRATLELDPANSYTLLALARALEAAGDTEAAAPLRAESERQRQATED